MLLRSSWVPLRKKVPSLRSEMAASLRFLPRRRQENPTLVWASDNVGERKVCGGGGTPQYPSRNGPLRHSRIVCLYIYMYVA